MGLEAIDHIIRESTLEFIQVTDNVDVDANVGITFIFATGIIH